jgi:hypothetical protein
MMRALVNRTVVQSSDQAQTSVKQQIREAIQTAKDAAREAQLDEAAARTQASQLQGTSTPLSPVDAQKAVKNAFDGSNGHPGTIVISENGAVQVYAPGQFPGVGTTTTQRNDDIPPQVIPMMGILGGTLVVCVIGFPLARAIARWLDRRSSTPKTSPDVGMRLQAIEQAVDSVAVEVERISEGQRFTTRLLNERTNEPARDLVVADREAVPLASMPANARRG